MNKMDALEEIAELNAALDCYRREMGKTRAENAALKEQIVQLELKDEYNSNEIPSLRKSKKMLYEELQCYKTKLEKAREGLENMEDAYCPICDWKYPKHDKGCTLGNTLAALGSDTPRLGECGFTDCRAVSGQVNHGYCHKCKIIIKQREAELASDKPAGVWLSEEEKQKVIDGLNEGLKSENESYNDMIYDALAILKKEGA